MCSIRRTAWSPTATRTAGPRCRGFDDPLARAARASGAGVLIHDRQGLQAAQPIDFGAGQTGVVRLGLSTAGLERDLRALNRRNLVTGLALLGVGLLLGLVLVGRITRPLAQLTASAEALAQGQFDPRVAIRTHDEREPLAGAFARMLARLEESSAEVRRLAFFDAAVTALPNRLQFRQLLDHALAEARRHGGRGAVLFLDLDHFKLINDNLGHDAGDRLLQAFAHRLTACLRGADIVARAGGDGPASAVARLGGDEFTIMLGGIQRLEDPARVASRVLAALDHPFDLGERTVVVGASIGIALFPEDGLDPQTLLKHADLAMYHAKQQGRSNFQFYSSRLGAAAVERLALERELRTALARDDELHYQPQLQAASGAVVGLEALLRWRHSRHGILPPCRILGLAEETGLILPIGSWVLRQACAAARTWSDAGVGPLCVGVNLAASQLVQADFIARVTGALEACGLAPERLELEITETAVSADGDAVAARRAEAQAAGRQARDRRLRRRPCRSARAQAPAAGPAEDRPAASSRRSASTPKRRRS